MAYAYSDVLNTLNNRTGNAVSAVQDQRVLINDAARSAWLALDLVESIQRSQAVSTLYDKIGYYPLPDDLKGESIIDLEFSSDKSGSARNINFEKVSIQQFQKNYGLNTFAIDYHKTSKWLRANISIDSNVAVLNEMDSTTGNGTWTAADNGTNIQTNTINFVAGKGSVSVDMAALGTVLSLQNTTMTQVDLTDYEDKASAFVWIYIPDTTNLTSVTLRWGIDLTTNYWEDTVTSPHMGSSFKIGWNLVRFDWLGATQTGSPTITAVDSAKISLTYSSTPTTLTGFLFDNIMFDNGKTFEFSYYSGYPWRNTSGTLLENSAADSDILNVSAESWEVVINHMSRYIAQAIPLEQSDVQRFEGWYKDSKKQYVLKYPSQRKKLKSHYWSY